MPINVKLLKKVRKLIAEEPKRLDMSMWNQTKSCGTAACLAGWIVFAQRPQLKRIGDNLALWLDVNEDVQIDDYAAKLIGMTTDDCPFYNEHWKAPEVLAWIDRQIDAASK